jgi:hypothetical protein
MRYLGRLHGEGVVTRDGRDVGRAVYEIDGFTTQPHGVTGSGEIRLRSADLADVFGCRGVRLRTDDGRLLDLRFSEGKRSDDCETAHVDVGGDLPTTAETWNG